ncbi:MAG: DUF5658 family protein [Steroidobacteraceae bacterium]
MLELPGLHTKIRTADRRRAKDRRKHPLRSLVFGHLNPRRHGPRRARDGSIASTDWYAPRWMLVAVMILLLSVADAMLTLTLISHGALEANPVMAPLVQGSPGGFAAVKLALTAIGVIVLMALARVRAFGRLPVGALLYVVLSVYAVLVAYELRMFFSLAVS